MGLFWRAGTALLAVVIVGCGSDTTTRCRSHATRYQASGAGITRDYPNIQTPIDVDCELDKALLERTCTARYQDQFGTPSVHTQTVRYASLADFVDEANPPGRVRAISVTVSHEGFDSGTIVAPYLHAGTRGETDYVYDSQKRLISHGFDSWDQGGRPLTISPSGSCLGDTGTRVTYNDTARTVTVEYSTPDPDGAASCLTGMARWTFDSDGNPTQYGDTSYSVQSREEICVDEED